MTHASSPLPPIDYLIVGHVTDDLQDDGPALTGGTVAFAGLTAAALGHQVGVLTACAAEKDLSLLSDLIIYAHQSENTTAFRNIPTEAGRVQYLYHRADTLDQISVPDAWLEAPIVHLGPVAAEIDPQIYEAFPNAMLCLTPQGWLRGVDAESRVHPTDWPFDHALLKAAHATVLSLEDVQGREELIDEFAAMSRILVVTENQRGCRVYWNGSVSHFPAPSRALVDDTGAGDIFAAAFFHRLYHSQDAWEAARFAVILAANSVSRRRLESIPTAEEIAAAQTEILG